MSLELRISHLFKTYNGNPILRDCSFAFASGRAYMLQGPNGSGKSTLFRLLALLEKPDGGRVEYREDGRVQADVLDLRRRLTLVLPRTGIFNTTVFHNVAFGLQIRGLGKTAIRERVEEALASVGLAHKKHQRASELSSGETKRLGIARAMVIEPEIFLLDEPTANIDPANTAIIEEIILALKRQRRATLLLITHDPAQAERLGDELLWLKDGKVVAA
ncbi:MAG: energy-coupling factor ABC transporter ATP-binding protein [Deltaproteobacteria bacterium]|nr:energy-coupling factor ABC transporter ATP-binding protein [Deltaproteobacteria bacterium]